MGSACRYNSYIRYWGWTEKQGRLWGNSVDFYNAWNTGNETESERKLKLGLYMNKSRSSRTNRNRKWIIKHLR